MARILVVEDSRTQAREIQFVLEDAGNEVVLAGNGVEGLAALQRGLPDVVLTDLDMPQMNGLELVEAVRRDYPSVPVILMTALGSEEIAVQALQQGAASYVPKRGLPQNIGPTLEAGLSAARGGGQEKRVLACMEQAEFRFGLDNDVSLIPPLLGHLRENVVRIQH